MNSRGSLYTTCFLSLFVCTACRPTGKPTEANTELKPRQVRDFAVLYNQNCAGCHGPDGKGNAALALANPVYLEIASDATIRRITASGIRGSLMPAFATSAGGTLTDEQIDILVREMRARWARPIDLSDGPPPPYASNEPGSALQGSRVFKSFCAGCHGPAGKGTPEGSSIVDPSFLGLVSDQDLRTTIIAGRPDLGHPDWRHCVPDRVMTPEEVADVIAWLVAQRRPSPDLPEAGSGSTQAIN